MARLIDEFNHWVLTISSAGGGGSSSVAAEVEAAEAAAPVVATAVAPVVEIVGRLGLLSFHLYY